ncbi:MAG: hypothetical protein R3A45_03680 [Bdellovibrionota bacterium]
MARGKNNNNHSSTINQLAEQFMRENSSLQGWQSDDGLDELTADQRIQFHDLHDETAIDFRSQHTHSRMTAYLWSWLLPFGGFFYRGERKVGLLGIFLLELCLFALFVFVQPELVQTLFSYGMDFKNSVASPAAFSIAIGGVFFVWNVGFLLPAWLIHRQKKHEFQSWFKKMWVVCVPVTSEMDKQKMWVASFLHLCIAWLVTFPVLAILPWVPGLTLVDRQYVYFLQWGLPLFGLAALIITLYFPYKYFYLIFREKGLYRMPGILLYTVTLTWLVFAGLDHLAMFSITPWMEKAQTIQMYLKLIGLQDSAAYVDQVISGLLSLLGR